MAIATDRVNPELVKEPRRWDIKFIRKFMITFGVVSSVFDYLIFVALLYLLRERRSFSHRLVRGVSRVGIANRFDYQNSTTILRKQPGAPLWIATLLVIVATVVLPYTELRWVFGFASMPATFLLVLVEILVLYIIAAEMAKKLFYRKQKL